MLDEIGSKDKVPAYIKKVKEGGVKLMGLDTASTRTTILGPRSLNGQRSRFLRLRGAIRNWRLLLSWSVSRWKTSIL